jgi:tetratricopeptide (TPR) repeat protein
VVESVDPADLDGLLALLRDSTDDERIGDLADALRAAGREPEACETYLRAFEIDPGDSEWQGALEPCEGVGDIFDAAADRAVASGDDERIGDAADALLARGNESRACELYRQALSLDPDDSEWIEKVGRCDGGGFEPTDGVVGGVVGGLGSREPENDSLVALGREALARGDRAGAITHFEAALLDAPADRDARTALMALTGRTLIAILESAAARAAQDDELLGDLADAYLEAGRRDDAVRAYERAAAIDPDDSEWQRKLDVLVPSRLSPR